MRDYMINKLEANTIAMMNAIAEATCRDNEHVLDMDDFHESVAYVCNVINIMSIPQLCIFMVLQPLTAAYAKHCAKHGVLR